MPGLGQGIGMGLTPKLKLAADFKINHSFLFDGGNEYFTIPNADLDPNIFGGTNNKYTIYIMLKRVGLGKNQYLLSNLTGGNMFTIYIDAANKPTLITNNNAKTLGSSVALASTSVYYFIKFSVDLQDTATNSHIKVDNVIQSLALNNLTATTPVSTGAYDVGRRNNNTVFFDGNKNNITVVNRLTTNQEDGDFYNNGKPINPIDVFGVDCKMFLNPDNSNDTAQFSWEDPVNGITATSFNMEDADKTTDTPY
jgi:hypothetical protein